MLFTSAAFLVFLPVVCLLWYLLPAKAKPYWLLLASYYFYFCWSPAYTLLLLATTLVNFAGGLAFAPSRNFKSEKTKKALFALQILLSLSGLFFFKYLNFFGSVAAGLLGFVGVSYTFTGVNFAAVGGISFYTFAALGYTIDVYSGKQEPERNFALFALFVSFFPFVISGPIARANNLLPQLKNPPVFESRNIETGFVQMLWGYFKKMVVADGLAIFVNLVYAPTASATSTAVFLATVFYSLQIYCDFSGYSDIAIGAAKAMGITVPANFNSPYFATNIRDFWNRWHISLSGWLQDYVFTSLVWSRWTEKVPFLKNKTGAKPPVFSSFLLTFLASGLWHGASWTYVVWGLLHGLLTGASTAFSKKHKKIDKYFKAKPAFVNGLYMALQTLGTFLTVTFTYIFFRAASLAQALAFVPQFFTGLFAFLCGTGVQAALITMAFFAANGPAILLCATGMLLLEYLLEYKSTGNALALRVRTAPFYLRWPLYYALLLAILFLGNFGQSQFIYFTY